MNELFADGGVIAANPSLFGGTYAWCEVIDGARVKQGSGAISPSRAGVVAISNNLTEMLALIVGLENLPHDWMGIVYSDSQITLGRVFKGWKWTNIPLWLHRRYQQCRQRLIHFDELSYELLAGHPTKIQLAAGIGRHGYKVSIHNVWCDETCRKAGEVFLSQILPKQVMLETEVAA